MSIEMLKELKRKIQNQLDSLKEEIREATSREEKSDYLAWESVIKDWMRDLNSVIACIAQQHAEKPLKVFSEAT